MHTDKPTLIDVSHVVEHGVMTYRGLPAPIICDGSACLTALQHTATWKI